MISKRYDHLLRLFLSARATDKVVSDSEIFGSKDRCGFRVSKSNNIVISTGLSLAMDTAGQERFGAITKQFYRRAQVSVV
ncbi:hypothetical protein DPMN_101481 [Dreissena polymorpha]|uniref:Uncharacterized protein n=1 Tax=Dreissena polymorpha TaxID=45954 RepID=A0A9D4R8D3_DREPO|nr:hypothetical protein DPMN_101481 [Dreissena polymorpha]